MTTIQSKFGSEMNGWKKKENRQPFSKLMIFPVEEGALNVK